MSASFEKKDNLNITESSNYRLVIAELPQTSMMCQGISLPGISIGQANVPSPLVDYSKSGDKVVFDPLRVDFLVDEDLGNWKEIWKWIMYLGFPISTKQFKKLILDNTEYKEVSDIGLILTTNKKNPNNIVTFVDAFPVDLAGLDFTTTSDGTVHISSSITFTYSYYYFGNQSEYNSEI